MTQQHSIPSRSLDFDLLGGMSIRMGGAPIKGLTSKKAQALLLYLACTRRPVPRDLLANLFFGDRPTKRAHSNLRTLLARLQPVSEYVISGRDAIAFNLSLPHRVDVVWMEQYLEGSQGWNAEEPSLTQVESLVAATDLYRGEFLAGFFLAGALEFDEWVTIERERLHRMAVDALHRLVEYALAHGEHGRGIEWAHRLLALDPMREEAHRQLMLLLARNDQRNAALAQFDACRRVLADELGVDPAPATMALYERILALEVSRGEQDERPPLRPHNLPRSTTLFVGRARELALLHAWLTSPSCRLVTIAGPGGIGKTRLALQTAWEMVISEEPLFRQGAYFIPLASVEEGAQLSTAIADVLALTFQGQASPEEQVVDYLRDKEMLLILDNVEQLRAEVARLAGLLRDAPGIALLVTSRERLAVAEEWLLLLEGLSAPPDPKEVQADTADDYESVQLFLSHASRLKPDWTLSNGEMEALSHLCRLLDGLPLGIELAVAWIHLLPLSEIARELERDLDFLTVEAHTLPERHRSLRAVFEHSWSVLSEQEKRVFRCLSVLRGGFTRQAAEEIAGAFLPILLSLEQKSLLRRDHDGRYQIHALLMQFAREKLAQHPEEERAARDRHSEHYARLVGRHAGALADERRGKETLPALTLEIENVRAAWRWAAEAARYSRLRVALRGLSRYYQLHGPFQEASALFEMAVEGLRADEQSFDDETRRLLGDLLVEQARFACEQSRYEEAIMAASEAVEIASRENAGDMEARSRILWGSALLHQGEYPTARVQLEQALERAREETLRREEADTLNRLGYVALCQGEHEQARQLCEQAQALFSTLGDPRGESAALRQLGLIHLTQGAYARAHRYHEEGLAICRSLGDQVGEEMILINQGITFYRQGRYPEARKVYERARRIAHQLGDRLSEAAICGNLGNVAFHQGDYDTARACYEEARSIGRAIGDAIGMGKALSNLGAIVTHQGDFFQARRYYGQALEILRERGHRWGEAVVLAGLGEVALYLGDYPQAVRYFEEARELREAIGDHQGVAHILANLSLLSLQWGNVDEALHLAREAHRQAHELNNPSIEGYALMNQGHSLMALGRLDEAGEAYGAALALREEMQQPHLAQESRAGLAGVAHRRNNLELALGLVNEILTYLEENTLQGTDDPMRVYLTCYRVLAALGDERAEAMLARGGQLLRERAALIEEPRLRQGYLENVPSHRELLQAEAGSGRATVPADQQAPFS